ncbi:MAG: hypothetical protein ACYCWW_14195 [Deltaproteobacteria bacterium]
MRALAVTLLSIALLVPLSRAATAQPESLPEGSNEDRDEKLPRAILIPLVLGYRVVAADESWIEAIQYYGDIHHARQSYEGLAPLLDRATDFDLDFDYVYQFAGQSVPFHNPEDHLWHNTRAAIALLQKGMHSSSLRWQIPWLLGYCLYVFRGDYAEAGDAINEASKRPGAPDYLSSLAARLLAKGGRVSTAIAMTAAALAIAPDDKTRDQLSARLQALALQKQLEELNLAARRLATAGVPFSSYQELASLLAGAPKADPYGSAYSIDSAGRVTSPNAGRVLQLYQHRGDSLVEPTAN